MEGRSVLRRSRHPHVVESQDTSLSLYGCRSIVWRLAACITQKAREAIDKLLGDVNTQQTKPVTFILCVCTHLPI
jgi:hypothetical protein